MARGFLLQNRLGPGRHIGAPGEQEAAAAPNLLVVRYPVAIDTPPTMTNNVAPLSGIFHNYTALMLEAIMAEVGPLAILQKQHGTLLKFLGMEAANRISAWRSVTKTFGGNEAGQVFGLIKQSFLQLPSAYAARQFGTLDSWQGFHPNKRPVLFGAVDGTGRTNQDMYIGVGGPFRCSSDGTSGTGGTYKYHFQYRGSRADHIDTIEPFGPFKIWVDVMHFFLWEGF